MHRTIALTEGVAIFMLRRNNDKPVAFGGVA
ncbi:hypothetical protein PB2503_10314 [Parvularcula bermudensis HTCC2503]|uniref:Uncharacterized protein n=1 Tax=Parvularcula bermudensis (strain ATCC BAA-594 / HTCC2503 / KCTC 12087) TaxID=314260 RepID=E0TFZ5_PARBH|nr:hypothetical protein PB2503_10314 [Parvularcula bermudensis HTCC2503]